MLTLNDPELALNDLELALSAAALAGKALCELRATGLTGRELMDSGDALAQQIICDALASHRPGDAVFSEEAVDDLTRLDAQRVWIVDPLDGTREFGIAGSTQWAVHIALWAENRIEHAVVGRPATDQIYDTTTVNLAPRERPGKLRLTVSQTRPPVTLPQIVQTLDAELVPIGSAGVKAMSVVDGQVDAYLHQSSFHQWDAAAPAAVAEAAGLVVTDGFGRPLCFNGRETTTPGIIVARPEVYDAVLAAALAAPAAHS